MRRLGLFLLLALSTACSSSAPSSNAEQRHVFVGDRVVADVTLEQVSPEHWRRTTRLRGRDDVSTVHVFYDGGRVTRGAYVRGVNGQARRSLSFEVNDGVLVLVDRLVDRQLSSGSQRERLRGGRLVFPFAIGPNLHIEDEPMSATLLSPSTGTTTTTSLHIGAQAGEVILSLPPMWDGGIRMSSTTTVGPGAFAEHLVDTAPPAKRSMPKPAARGRVLKMAPTVLDGLSGQHVVEQDDAVYIAHSKTLATTTPLPKHMKPELFLQSDAPAVLQFVDDNLPKRPHPLTDAMKLAEVIHRKLQQSDDGGPPSALDTLQRWEGDCDNATALLVAALRARGHAARPVVGYRIVGDVRGPHAWAEVHTPKGWTPVDALVPGIGPFTSHIPLFEGLGTPWDMGRVLFQDEWVRALPSSTTEVDRGMVDRGKNASSPPVVSPSVPTKDAP